MLPWSRFEIRIDLSLVRFPASCIMVTSRARERTQSVRRIALCGTMSIAPCLCGGGMVKDGRRTPCLGEILRPPAVLNGISRLSSLRGTGIGMSVSLIV